MALEDLEKKLYGKKEGKPSPQEGKSQKKKEEKPVFGSAWGNVPAPSAGRQKLRITPRAKKVASFTVGFLLVLAGGFFILRYLLLPPELDISVEGSKEVHAGEPVDYTITFENRTRSELRDVAFTLRLENGISFAGNEDELVRQHLYEGVMAPGTEKQERVSLVFWGKTEEKRSFTVSFRYQMGSLATRFEKLKVVEIRIRNPAVAMTIELPERTITDDPFSFSFGWKSLLSRVLPKAHVFLEPPDGFTLLDTMPKGTGTPPLWEVENLSPDAEGKVVVSGRVSGEEGAAKRFRIRFVVPLRGEPTTLVEEERELAIIGNPLALALSVNGEKEYVATLGETVEYRITFKNSFEVPLRDVVILVKLESPLFDLSSISTAGAFSSGDRTIRWHGGNTPQLLALNPQESGSVSFRVRVLSAFPGRLTENTLKLIAEISSPTKPPSLPGARLVFAQTSHSAKVRGVLELTSKVFRQDPTSRFTNFGPIPPKANQGTEYAVHIIVSAKGNDFREVAAHTTLPNWVTFTGKTSGQISGTEFVYNPRTNEIRWEIPQLPAFESREVIFQIRATPSLNQINTIITLLDGVEVAGVDDFTEAETLQRVGAVPSDLPDDPAIGYDEGLVQP